MPKKKINKTVKIGKILFLISLLILTASLVASAITKLQVMFYWVVGLSALGIIILLLIIYSLMKASKSTGNWLNEGI